MRYVIRLAVLFCCTLASLVPASAEKRVALVIGNGSYAHIAHLPNVPNDAAAMAALFKSAKFDSVDVKHNLSVADLRRALKDFAGRAADADVAVLFYAGHGIEVGQTNYLIPVDARLVTDFDVEDEAVPLDRVLQAMEPAKRLRLVILDACRENPFLKSMKRTVAGRSVGRGLGRVEPSTSDTLIAYATKANAIADDGKGLNSPFTAALVKHLLTPELDLRLALGYVRDEVLATTARRQEPYVTGSLGGATVSLAASLAVGEPKPGVAPAPLPLSAAERTWAAVKDTTSIPALEAFRQRYGNENAVYDRLAEARIEELKKAQVAIATPPPPSKVVAPTAALDLAPRHVFRDCADVCPEMVVLPAGEFMMGSSSAEIGALMKEFGLDWCKSEGPQRKVTITRPFAVGKYEVTFAEWDACVADGGCIHRPSDEGRGRGRRPVIDVSWDDAKEYVAWLSRKTGKTYRLLSEAEWEYAARAGTTTRYAFGDTITTSQAQIGFDVGGESAEVGSFPANKFGLHDMHGNVREWVEDNWHSDYQSAPLDGSVWKGGDVSLRVLRGGSWDSNRHGLRSAYRIGDPPNQRIGIVGFRVARTL